MKQDDAKNMNQTVSDQNDWNLSPQIGKVKLSSYVWRKISWQLLDFLFWITGQPVSHHTVKAIGNCILEQHQDNYWTSYFQIVWRSLFNKRHVILAPACGPTTRWLRGFLATSQDPCLAACFQAEEKSSICLWTFPKTSSICLWAFSKKVLNLLMDIFQQNLDLFLNQ